jgi:HlyD family secretion protein
MDIERKDFAKKRRNRRVLTGVLGVLVVTGITYAVAQLEPAAPPVDRGVIFPGTVERGDMTIDVRGLGTLAPEDIVVISARDGGRVDTRHLQPGMAVEPNTILVTLSSPELEQQVFDIESQLRGADADYANLEAQLETERMSQRSTVVQAEGAYESAKIEHDVEAELSPEGNLKRRKLKILMDQAKARLEVEQERVAVNERSGKARLAAQRASREQLERRLELEKGKLARLNVRAGIHGVLQQMDVEVGQLVTPGTILARVVDPKRLKAELRISETQAKDVMVGQRATIDTRSEVLDGEVIRVDPTVLNGTVTIDVRLAGELPAYLRPDLSVDGRVILDHRENVLKVSRPVYAQRDSTISLFKMEPDGIHASRVQVSIGQTSVNEIEILEGLQAGDEVILSDMSAWDDYDRIRLQ